jgi:hypothetical protein
MIFSHVLYQLSYLGAAGFGKRYRRKAAMAGRLKGVGRNVPRPEGG